MWYIWFYRDSPLFGKDKMDTFESYFIADKEAGKEILEQIDDLKMLLDAYRSGKLPEHA